MLDAYGAACAAIDAGRVHSFRVADCEFFAVKDDAGKADALFSRRADEMVGELVALFKAWGHECSQSEEQAAYEAAADCLDELFTSLGL